MAQNLVEFYWAMDIVDNDYRNKLRILVCYTTVL